MSTIHGESKEGIRSEATLLDDGPAVADEMQDEVRGESLNEPSVFERVSEPSTSPRNSNERLSTLEVDINDDYRHETDQEGILWGYNKNRSLMATIKVESSVKSPANDVAVAEDPLEPGEGLERAE